MFFKDEIFIPFLECWPKIIFDIFWYYFFFCGFAF